MLATRSAHRIPRIVTALVAVGCVTALAAQRHPVPGAAALDIAHSGALHTVIDRLLVDQGEYSADVRSAQLLSLAVNARPSAESYLLYQHSLRVARERGTLRHHRLVIDALGEAFAVDTCALLVEELEGRRRVRGDACSRGLVVSLVSAVQASLDAGWTDAQVRTASAWAEASGDARLHAWTTREVDGLLAALQAGRALDPSDQESVEAFLDAHAPPAAAPAEHKIDLIGRADRLRARARGEAQIWIRQNLRRRAWRSYARAWPISEGLERTRIESQLSRLEDLIADDQLLGTLAFADPSDLGELVFARGQWRVHGGALRGKAGDAGTASTATHQLAYQAIDCVRIRGGIDSDDGLNFRAAIGPCNLLFNWEVARESHIYAGDHKQVVPTHLLTSGKTHDIRIRQLGETTAIFLDGSCIAQHNLHLQGTIAVYPALQSAIFLDDLTVIGDLDPKAEPVQSPSHTCR